MILRSMMFVPGHNQRLMASARRSAADALILDLEDSVPESDKTKARDGALQSLEIDFERPVFVRVNNMETIHCQRDLHSLTEMGVTGFVLPKVSHASDVKKFAAMIADFEILKGFGLGYFKIVPLIETTAAVCNILEICQATPRVIAVAFGCEDFLVDLVGNHDLHSVALNTPRAMIALAARAAGVIPIDTVHTNLHDLDHLQQNLQLARALGFEGMLVLHPKELPLVHKYFSPSVADIERARVILKLAQQATAQGKGVAILDGKFVGPPLVAMAQKVLQRAKEIECAN